MPRNGTSDHNHLAFTGLLLGSRSAVRSTCANNAAAAKTKKSHAKARKGLPAWDNTSSNLDAMRLSPAELTQRRAARVSRHLLRPGTAPPAPTTAVALSPGLSPLARRYEQRKAVAAAQVAAARAAAAVRGTTHAEQTTKGVRASVRDRLPLSLQQDKDSVDFDEEVREFRARREAALAEAAARLGPAAQARGATPRAERSLLYARNGLEEEEVSGTGGLYDGDEEEEEEEEEEETVYNGVASARQFVPSEAAQAAAARAARQALASPAATRNSVDVAIEHGVAMSAADVARAVATLSSPPPRVPRVPTAPPNQEDESEEAFLLSQQLQDLATRQQEAELEAAQLREELAVEKRRHQEEMKALAVAIEKAKKIKQEEEEANAAADVSLEPPVAPMAAQLRKLGEELHMLTAAAPPALPSVNSEPAVGAAADDDGDDMGATERRNALDAGDCVELRLSMERSRGTVVDAPPLRHASVLPPVPAIDFEEEEDLPAFPGLSTMRTSQDGIDARQDTHGSQPHVPQPAHPVASDLRSALDLDNQLAARRSVPPPAVPRWSVAAAAANSSADAATTSAFSVAAAAQTSSATSKHILGGGGVASARHGSMALLHNQRPAPALGELNQNLA